MADLIRIALNLPVFGLVLCRSAGIMLAAPILSSISIPVRLKAALAVLLAIIMYPLAAVQPLVLPQAILGYLPVVATELGLGLIMGLAASMVIAALNVAGALMAQQIGMAMSRVVSPDTQLPQTAISVFLGLLGLLLFLAIDGHHWFIQSLAVSYTEVPIGEARWTAQATQSVLGGFSGLFIVALKVAAPVMGIMFMISVLIALLAKAVPQMNILLVGYPVKVFVGMTAMVLTFPFMWPVISDAFRGLQVQLLTLSRVWRS